MVKLTKSISKNFCPLVPMFDFNPLIMRTQNLSVQILNTSDKKFWSVTQICTANGLIDIFGTSPKYLLCPPSGCYIVHGYGFWTSLPSRFYFDCPVPSVKIVLAVYCLVAAEIHKSLLQVIFRFPQNMLT